MPAINADHVRRLKLQIAVRVCLQRRWKRATIRSTHIFVREGREEERASVGSIGCGIITAGCVDRSPHGPEVCRPCGRNATMDSPSDTTASIDYSRCDGFNGAVLRLACISDGAATEDALPP